MNFPSLGQIYKIANQSEYFGLSAQVSGLDYNFLGSSVKEWVQAQYSGLVSWVIIQPTLDIGVMVNDVWLSQETNPVYWAYTHCLTQEPWTDIFFNLHFDHIF